VTADDTASDDTVAGLLVLDPDQGVESANLAARRWLDQLGGDRSGARLPVAVRSVAARARDVANGEAAGSGARVRVRRPAGRWVVMQGSLLGDGPEARTAVLLEAARPVELAPLIADALGLTDRERRVVELVAQGFATSEIGARLHLSAYTVQDHLKAIFDKTGTRTRGELVARLFFDHYAPRLANRPLPPSAPDSWCEVPGTWRSFS
jgi:DNA-binding CsgD family transcriptional regulator